ncbi:response regulator [Spirosoma sp. BT702]|uniref:histidine kinase n=1 Tax=Spirosoma profusum TaxID=2771354 RepID=A0A926XWJ9_9BACT|nr:two-component regulator propeller domain-containing protein [Spirosoma profusum]MBD2701947.1 response regulator [Spirosoma profusum]
MSFTKTILFSGLWAVYSFSLRPVAVCQSELQTFSHLSVEEGLSQSSVYAITQDTKGFMWFGTRDGLNRFDSHRVAVYNTQGSKKNSLPSNTINGLLVDKRGQLWVGTSRGLTRYRPLQDDFERISFADSRVATLPDSNITSLFEDHQQQLWVGTLHGLYRLHPKNPNQYQPIKTLTKNPLDLSKAYIRTIYQDREHTLWVGTSAGLTRLRPMKSGQFQLTNYFLAPADSIYHDVSNGVNAIAEDQSGRLWVGTERKGIAIFDKRTGHVVSWHPAAGLDLSMQTVRTIQPDGKGSFWVGTMSGLYIIAQDGNRFKTLTNQPADPGSLSDNSIRSLFQDRDGSFWVGTYYGGVDMYSPLARQFGSFRPLDRLGGMPFKIASSILPAQNPRQLWLGTEDKGLLLVNNNQTIARHFKHDPKNAQSLSNDKVKCLLADGTKGLWIGTIKGLNYLDVRRQVITQFLHEPTNPRSLPNDRIYDLKRDKQGTLWVAINQGGLCRYDPITRSFVSLVHQASQKTSLSANSITTLLIDSQGALWVGTMGGLNRKMDGKDEFIRFIHRDDDATSISSNHISCFFEDQYHRLWIGTRDNGLNLLLPDGRTFKHITSKQGLPSNSVMGIQEDSRGWLWISTDKGLVQFDPQQESFIRYNKNDGLICKEFTPNSTYQDTRGYLYFGGYNGIVRFHPDSIRRNNKAPLLAFTQLRLFNEQVTNLPSGQSPVVFDDKQGLTFTHRQNVFSLDFAAFNFINSAKNRYAYKLLGFDNDWNYVSEPRALYMNLEPGDYVLQVKGANNDEVWARKPLELVITVLPPFWKTYWAYALYVVIFVILLRLWSGFNRSRMRLAHELEVEHLEKNRQQELHQTKLNFFTEIAHEIRTPLTLVIGPLETLTERYVDEPFIQKQVAVMRNSTDRLLRLLNQLLDFRKHETGNVQLHRQQTDVVVFLRTITDSFLDYARSRQITLTNESEVATLFAWIDAGEMEKVIYNLLLNAFKFTPAGSTISVRLQQDFTSNGIEKAIIIIEDAGVGIPAGDLDHIFNRFYQVNQAKTRDSGFGLGLALSKSIVEQHNGQITVESQEAERDKLGFTRFTITLPLLSNTSDSMPPSAQSTVLTTLPSLVTETAFESTDDTLLETQVSTIADKPLLMIVEDQADIRVYIRELFSRTYQIIEAQDGLEAWEKASQLLPDIIITDVAMPFMDGLALTQRLKSDERTSHIPVILLTAKDTVDNQLAGLEIRADDYVAKPFHPMLLQARVRNLLRLRQQLKAKYHRIVSLQPEAPELDHPDEKFLRQLMTLLNSHLSDADFNVTSLVSEMGMSRPVLFRKVKMLTGLSVIDLLRTTRLKKAELLLKQKKMSVAEVAFSVGYNDPKYFSRAFRAQFGQTPTEYIHQLAESV